MRHSREPHEPEAVDRALHAVAWPLPRQRHWLVVDHGEHDALCARLRSRGPGHRRPEEEHERNVRGGETVE
eukprot:10961211-Heterocapsa_arctica.AAC.1